MIIEELKIKALAKELDIDIEEAEEMIETGDYTVLTDEEADEQCAEYIKDSVWAFNSSFLSSMTGLPEEMYKAVQDKCEGAEDAVLQCIENSCGIEDFIEAAVDADGRGHFMSSYDGEEAEVQIDGQYLYIYRIN